MVTGKKGPLERAFERYHAMIAPCVDEESVAVLRDAFFSGAAILHTTLIGGLEDTGDANEITAGDMALMSEIDRELRAFGEDFDRRNLPTLRGPAH